MSVPCPFNNTCDIYRFANSPAPPAVPPGPPDVAAVDIALMPDFARGHQEQTPDDVTWTHVALMEPTVDIRDAYNQGALAAATNDFVYIPDKNGVRYEVVFVERLNKGAATDHKRVYLDRSLPAWPTNEV